jgi:hypothetical protein
MDRVGGFSVDECEFGGPGYQSQVSRVGGSELTR